MDDREKYPVRKRTRLENFDYASPNYYFVTICTHDKKCILGKPGTLNTLGKIARDALLNIPQHFPHAIIDKYVVMPNHIHAIIVLRGEGISLSHILGQYKSHVTRQIRHIHPGTNVWQRSFHDRIIRNQKEYEAYWLYIDANPINWEKDEHFQIFPE